MGWNGRVCTTKNLIHPPSKVLGFTVWGYGLGRWDATGVFAPLKTFFTKNLLILQDPQRRWYISLHGVMIKAACISTARIRLATVCYCRRLHVPRKGVRSARQRLRAA